MEKITYKPGNEKEVKEFIGNDKYHCGLCDGSGEYETVFGTRDCQICHSSIIPFVDVYGRVQNLDYGETAIRVNGNLFKWLLSHSGEGE